MPDFADAVLAAVERIPAGRVASYGDIAELIGSRAPRSVGWVMATYGSAVPWHRVVRADGTPAPRLAAHQLELLAGEGVIAVNGRVAMSRFRWQGH